MISIAKTTYNRVKENRKSVNNSYRLKRINKSNLIKISSKILNLRQDNNNNTLMIIKNSIALVSNYINNSTLKANVRLSSLL